MPKSNNEIRKDRLDECIKWATEWLEKNPQKTFIQFMDEFKEDSIYKNKLNKNEKDSIFSADEILRIIHPTIENNTEPEKVTKDEDFIQKTKEDMEDKEEENSITEFIEKEIKESGETPEEKSKEDSKEKNKIPDSTESVHVYKENKFYTAEGEITIILGTGQTDTENKDVEKEYNENFIKGIHDLIKENGKDLFIEFLKARFNLKYTPKQEQEFMTELLGFKCDIIGLAMKFYSIAENNNVPDDLINPYLAFICEDEGININQFIPDRNKLMVIKSQKSNDKKEEPKEQQKENKDQSPIMKIMEEGFAKRRALVPGI